MNIRKFLPIKIHSIYLGVGYWWGCYFFFIKDNKAIVPMHYEYRNCIFMKNGRSITEGAIHSWSSDVQAKMKQPKFNSEKSKSLNNEK